VFAQYSVDYTQKIGDDINVIVSYSKIDVAGIIRFRNQITHDYGNVDFSFYQKLVEKDVMGVKEEF